jgi:TorA maturation chaperone TorD
MQYIQANSISRSLKYILRCVRQFATRCSNKARYKNYLDVLQLIIDYSNGYGKGLERIIFMIG